MLLTAPQHSSTGDTVPGFPTLNPEHGPLQNSMNGQHMLQENTRPTWGYGSNMIQGQPAAVDVNHGSKPYRRLQSAHMRADHHPQQPQIRGPQQHVAFHPDPKFPISQYGPADWSQPFDNYGTTQTVGRSPNDFVPLHPRTPNSAPYENEYLYLRAGSHGTRDSNSRDSQRSTQQSDTAVGYSASRSHPHQNDMFSRQAGYGSNTAAHSSSHIHPSSSAAYNQYQSTGMGRTQSGPGMHPLGFPATPETHGHAQNYQNPLVKAGLQQYLPRQHTGYANDSSAHPTQGHSYQADTSAVHQGQWPSSNTSLRTAASDPQFVSGPWASSTPPTGEGARHDRPIA